MEVTMRTVETQEGDELELNEETLCIPASVVEKRIGRSQMRNTQYLNLFEYGGEYKNEVRALSEIEEGDYVFFFDKENKNPDDTFIWWLVEVGEDMSGGEE